MANRIGMIALGVACFVCGVFAGIWIGSRGEKIAPTPAGRNIVFTVEPYEKANLQVQAGDTIEWKRAAGGDGNLGIDFPSGDAPCKNWTNGDRKCEIDSNKQGAFLYSCEDKAGQTFDCPDPGIQQRTTPPFQVQYPNKTEKTSPATVLAAVACKNGDTVEVTPSGGKEGDPIKVQPGQTIYWDSPYDFMIAIKGASPCNTLPTSVQPGPLFCPIASGSASGTFSYTATAKDCKNPAKDAQIMVSK